MSLTMSLARSPLAPVLGRRVPVRGPARLLYHSYSKTQAICSHRAKRLTTALGDDFEVDLSSFLEWQLWAFGSYERHLAELFSYLLVPGQRCIDVGANIGIHTVRLAKLVGASGEIIALEPDDDLARRASRNVLLNNLRNVRILQVAASDRTGGSVILYRPDIRSANKGQASLVRHDHLTGPTVQVPMTRIDDVARGSVALIKIDVEGHEAAVISGAMGTISDHQPSLIFEYDPNYLKKDSNGHLDLLRNQGYKIYGIVFKRKFITGRGKLRLERMETAPTARVNILAIPAWHALNLHPLVRRP